MPAAAVIPALIAYIKVVAVKKLVVGFWCPYSWPGVNRVRGNWVLLSGNRGAPFIRGFSGSRTLTLNKLECLKQAFA